MIRGLGKTGSNKEEVSECGSVGVTEWKKDSPRSTRKEFSHAKTQKGKNLTADYAACPSVGHG